MNVFHSRLKKTVRTLEITIVSGSKCPQPLFDLLKRAIPEGQGVLPPAAHTVILVMLTNQMNLF